MKAVNSRMPLRKEHQIGPAELQPQVGAGQQRTGIERKYESAARSAASHALRAIS
jgi:hypothetical protein